MGMAVPSLRAAARAWAGGLFAIGARGGAAAALLATALYLLALVAVTVHSYHTARAGLFARLDRELTIAARGVPFVLADDFHDRALHATAITAAEDQRNIGALTALAQQGGFAYLYTMIERDGIPRLTASSASDEELTGGSAVRYFQPFEEGAALLAASRPDGGPVAVTHSDRWGTFRAVLLPRTSPGGRPYTVAAEFKTAQIQPQLWQATVRELLGSLLLLGASLPMFLYIGRELRTRRLQVEREVAARTADLTYLADHDPLTGVCNRRAFQRLLEQAAADRGQVFSLLVCDLDHFKSVNDRHGHEAGDRVLQAFTAAVQCGIRITDQIGRVGGEEFTVLLPGTNKSQALIAAGRILARVRALRVATADGVRLGVTVSIGLVASDEGNGDVAGLLAIADRRLYRAKRTGRDRVAADDERTG